MIGRTVRLPHNQQFNVTPEIRRITQFIVGDFTMSRRFPGKGFKSRAYRGMETALYDHIIAQAPDARLGRAELMTVVKLLTRWDMDDCRAKGRQYRMLVAD